MPEGRRAKSVFRKDPDSNRSQEETVAFLNSAHCHGGSSRRLSVWYQDLNQWVRLLI
jgi:hypothetical protein